MAGKAGKKRGGRGGTRARIQRPKLLSRFAAVFQRYRILFVIYGVGLLVGVREFYVARQGAAVDWDSEAWAEMTEVMTRINPDDPDTDFLEGVQSMVSGDGDGMVSHYEDALATQVKHNDFLLQDYAQHLLATGADWREVNAAVNRWRDNYPFSNETLALTLGAGPRNQSEASVLVRELHRVSWIAGARLEPYQERTRQRWRALLTFRPARPVDVRDAVAAVSILAVPEADRGRYTVTCATLTDCSVVAR